MSLYLRYATQTWSYHESRKYSSARISSTHHRTLESSHMGHQNSPEGFVAAGYADGSIRIWDGDHVKILFNGHRGAVTALGFDPLGARLASGSADTDLIVWDVVAECGLARFRGHKDQITGLSFLTRNGLDHIVSCSKDSLIKFWDIGTKHCVETVIGHRGEVWALDVGQDERMLLTGAADGEVRVWTIDPDALSQKLEPGVVAGGWDESTEPDAAKRAVTSRGVLERQSKERVVTLKVHPNGRYIAAQGADRLVQVYRIRTLDEIKKKLARLKKRKEKKNKGEQEESEPVLTVADEIPCIGNVRCSAKIRSFDFSLKSQDQQDTLTLLCALANNSIQVHVLEPSNKEQPTRLITGIDMPGHRTDVRCLALSPDNQMLASGSSESIKIWNVHSGQCVKTLESGYALCCEFIGPNLVVVGTKSGQLHLFDLARGLLETIEAHEGPVWSLQVWPDRKGVTTGSQDKEIKFWECGMVVQDGVRRAALVHTRTLRMSDNVLCIRYSPDGKLLAIALLDSTVKVLYADTLKFFLSLYGHKLPVMSMDISSDNFLIITASSDKTIKIWGLDFGDCHKSLFAHQDAVMSIRFVWGTHYFFSTSKDKTLKYWDADKFEQILKLDGHAGEVWALAVSKYGNQVFTGSHDRSIRIWEKTDDQFTLDEEREKELEELYDQTLFDAPQDAPIGSGVDHNDSQTVIDNDTSLPTKQTPVTLQSTDRLIAALDTFAESTRNKPTKETIKSAAYTVYTTLKTIRPTDLDTILIVLSFSHVLVFLKVLDTWIENSWNLHQTTRILTTLLKTHHHQLTSTTPLTPLLLKTRKTLKTSLQSQKNVIGFNVAGLKVLRGVLGSEISGFGIEEVESLDVGKEKEKEREGKRGKRKRVVVVS
ncbi:uncharacterized protein SPPG_01809 [Spizellomyces punctatus DAOM BR117]|uniref:Small-subunit processome Utp12 domain-containing protein n=1 Tax=Spizellomyces punctatus (strain DAOM BR117) TaxID=645134 RepID=A0A0L0HMS1_SPIPD|nr:uncharacterized protein SPPG_01809 [Spizellomyces punctatus DAOM BR117]KND02726.1 hypothetical protein SPPG_01809 [Spizellomyces punctatus DAOM BR117]|eukprot:XP_016610765.1 hypothetical protein SPPG_01809 [Spizellomyces punctatus DAOM BR117]